MTTKTIEDITALGKAAHQASRKLARLSTEDKNQVLLNLAGLLRTEQEAVLSANQEDYQEAKADGLDESLLDRLLLTSDRLKGTADEIQKVAELPDPIGEVIETTSLPNGLVTSRRRVPLGVVGSIYEARPNVTVDIFGLCLKSGNACILRGGKETIRSNTPLFCTRRMMKEYMDQMYLPAAVASLRSTTTMNSALPTSIDRSDNSAEENKYKFAQNI